MSGTRARYVRQRALQLWALSTVGLLLPLLADLVYGLLPTLDWALDLAVHAQLLYAAVAVVSAVACAVLRHQPRWLAASLVALVPLLTAAPARPDADGAGRTRHGLTVASLNVHVDNADAAEALAWLAREQVDVAVLLEVSPEFEARLAAMPGWPHRVVRARGDPFGIAVVSRLPIKQAAVQEREGRPVIEATLDWGFTDVRLYAVHPMPPFDAAYAAQRDTLLADVGQKAANAGQPALMLGDFNATPWSVVMRAIAALGMRRATGLLATWPSDTAPALGLRLDHVLVSPHWRGVADSVGPHMASDHRGVVVRLEM